MVEVRMERGVETSMAQLDLGPNDKSAQANLSQANFADKLITH
jgi:hypothetical protein